MIGEGDETMSSNRCMFNAGDSDVPDITRQSISRAQSQKSRHYLLYSSHSSQELGPFFHIIDTVVGCAMTSHGSASLMGLSFSGLLLHVNSLLCVLGKPLIKMLRNKNEKLILQPETFVSAGLNN